jgi:hypothetical protein
MAKPINKKKWFKPFKNGFVITLVLFTGWMLFVDDNSWFVHHELKLLRPKKNIIKKK